MTCFHPLSAFQTDDGEIVFVERGRIRRPLSLPCGQCIGCRLDRAREWAIRCVHESQCHESNCFITLTYSDDFVPRDMSLDYSHFQLFMKRLRFKLGKCRFYMCGEYGPLEFRPHFHACLFGVDFPDRSEFMVSCDRSAILEKLWPFGYSSVGDVTFQSASYVARYVCDKVTGSRARSHYERVDGQTGEVWSVVPEFTRMSLKPGIGMRWFARYHSEVVMHDGCVVQGRMNPVPRYYDKLIRELPIWDEIEYARYKRAALFRDDNTRDRLAVREEVARARLACFKRNSL